MLLIALALLLAAPEDLEARLRHLESVAEARSPAPSPDGGRLAFVTTLFGSRQVASMAVDGSWPVQLTDEPDGAVAARYSTTDPKVLVAIALREDERRLLFLDEEANAPAEVDSAPGDQILGGFSRDGKRLVYACVQAAKPELRVLALDTKKAARVAPPPPAAGAPAPPAGSQPVEAALAGLVALSPPSPDGRLALAVVRRGDGEALLLVDLVGARAETIGAADGRARWRWPKFSPDGRTIYVLTDAGRSTMGVDTIALPGRVRKPLYAPGRDLEAYALSEDGHRLAVAAEQNGETLFSLRELPSLRAQPLPQPPAGALAPSPAGEPPMVWSKSGDRLYFGWRLPDDTTDLWTLRLGYGTALRLTRSPRPGLPRDAIPRPRLVRIPGAAGSEGDLQAWLWRPPDVEKPRVAVLVSSQPVRPVFDKRIAALNFGGLAVLAVNGKGAQAAALRYIKQAPDLDPRDPVLLDFDGIGEEKGGPWAGVVGPRAEKGGLQLDPQEPDLVALVRYARRPGG